MQWKYSFPDPWPDPKTRVALEDVYLIPADEHADVQACWFTLEGLGSFTGGTQDEKLDRLAGAEYVIDDSMDMLIHREDFDKAELLEWTRILIRQEFGDPDPILVEADENERPRQAPHSRGTSEQPPHPGRTRVLFVCPQGGPELPSPEGALGGNPPVEVRIMYAVDVPLNPEAEALISWADVLVVLDTRMRQVFRRRFRTAGKSKRVLSFPLPVHANSQDPEYSALLRERFDAYLAKLGPEPTR
jgi:predicted protein tyrosine phosphatase